jgi:hypothetical protein
VDPPTTYIVAVFLPSKLRSPSSLFSPSEQSAHHAVRKSRRARHQHHPYPRGSSSHVASLPHYPAIAIFASRDGWQLLIRVLLQVDATFQANSGHPGAPMGMAPVAHVVWNKFMTFNPKNPDWVNRDRFVLSYVFPAILLHPKLRVLRQFQSADPGVWFAASQSRTRLGCLGAMSLDSLFRSYASSVSVAFIARTAFPLCSGAFFGLGVGF